MAAVDPEVICPHCFEAFAVSDMPVEGLDGTCPHCGGRLADGDFDRARDEVPARAAELAARLEAFHASRDGLALRQFKTRWGLVKRFYAWRIRRLNEENAALVADEAQARRRAQLVARLPESRYYTSRWFLQTGRPLSREARGPLSAYTLVPRYLDDGTFALWKRGKGSEGWGILGEWQVFERLRHAREDGALPVGTCILPNLYLSNRSSDEMSTGASGSWSGSRFSGLRTLGDIRPLFSQIDCMVLTAHAVYLIEVKNNHSAISVAADGAATASRGARAPMSLWRDAKQCSDHASAFATCFPDIPFERIYELTVYTNAMSFSTEMAGFVDNAYVGACADGPGDFAALIGREERRLQDRGPLFDGDELQAFARHLMDTASDRDGRKEYLHLERLRFLGGR